jgi:large subunit ribosomal protein L24
MIKKIKNHIKKGDQVKIISGEQKGFLGKIEKILTKKSSVILEGILPRIKFVKNSKTTNQQQESKKIELPILIHISNVMLWDKEKNQVSRIGYKIENKNITNQKIKTKKERYFKKSGSQVPDISKEIFQQKDKNKKVE